MSTRGITLALAAAALTVPSTAIFAQSEADLLPVVKATVRIQALDTGRTGTGWVIAAADEVNRAGAAVIVTSLNVIDGSKAIKVSEPADNEVTRQATVISRDTDRNLAFLEVKDIVAKAIPIARIAPKLGRTIHAAGYNRTADDSEQASAATASTKNGSLAREYRGLISTVARADVNQLELDATLIPGYEGGPLVDDCGRLIGINMKSGGKVVAPANMTIDPASTVINALKSDEVIAAANSARVNYQIQDGACGSSGAVEGQASGDPTAIATDEATVLDQPPSPNGIGAWIRDNLVLMALLLLGVVAALFGIVTLTRRKDDLPQSPPAHPIPAESRRPEPASPSEVEAETVLLGDSRKATTKATELRLTGRGPGGEAIDIRIASDTLEGKGTSLGVGANAGHKIPDNRPDHKVSRLHALIAWDGQKFTVEDNKSLNGTKIEGRPLDPHVSAPLVHGDTITLADITLKVSII